MADLTLFVQDLMLENPISLVTVFVAAGLLMFLQGRRTANRKILLIGLVFLLIAVGVILLSTAVKTPREKLVAQTTRLVDLAQRSTIDDFSAMFTATAILVGPDGSMWLAFDELLSELDTVLRRHAPADHRVQTPSVAVRDHRGQSVLDVHSRLEVFPKPVRTQWLIDWELDRRGQWKVVRIQWLKFEQREPIYRMWQ